MAISVEIDDELKGRIQFLANARRRSAHWIMREAITRYVEQEEERENIHRAAEAAWRSYQDTGLHVTFEEADAWLVELENGNLSDPPECHR